MRNTSTYPSLWIKVGLAILPGLWIVIWQGGALGQAFDLVGTVVLAVIGSGIIGFTVVAGRCLAAWSLPSVGALFWIGWKWGLGLLNARQIVAPLIFGLYERLGVFYTLFGLDPGLPVWIVFLALIICGTYLAYKRAGLRISRLEWKLWIFPILVTVVYVCLYVLPHYWLSFGGVLSLALMFVSVAIGFPLSKREGLGAGLLVASCVVASFDMMFYSNFLHVIRMYAYESPSTKFESSLLVLSILPYLCFLVVIPIGVLCSRSSQSQRIWLLVPTFLILASMGVIRGLVLQGTPAEYSVSAWLEYSVTVLQLWVPLLLATVLYTRQSSRSQDVIDLSGQPDGVPV